MSSSTVDLNIPSPGGLMDDSTVEASKFEQVRDVDQSIKHHGWGFLIAFEKKSKTVDSSDTPSSSDLTDDSAIEASSFGHLRGRTEFDRFIKDRIRHFLIAFEKKIKSDIEEMNEEGVSYSSPEAINAARRFVERMAPFLALAQQLKWGTFAEEDGGVSLIFQSLITDRYVKAHVSTDGGQIEMIRIDEGGKSTLESSSTTNKNLPRELAEWVISRV